MKPAWDQLGNMYKGHRTVLIADVDCTVHQGLCGKHGVQGYPTIKVYTKDKPKGEPYNGGRDLNALKKFAADKLDTGPGCSLEAKEECDPASLKILEESEAMPKNDRNEKIKEMEQTIKDNKQKAKELEKEAKKLAEYLEIFKLGGVKAEKVEQMLGEDEFKDKCESTCVIVFLPHILDSGAAGRKKELKVIDEVFKKNKADGTPMGFLWSQGGDQFEMEEKLSLQFGFPAVIAVNLKKESYGIHRGTFDKNSLGDFLRSLSIGRVPLSPIPKGLKISKTEAWDGKDGQIPSEDL